MAKKKIAAPAPRKARSAPAPKPLPLTRDDLKRMILELAVQVAPADIEFALNGREGILARAHAAGSHLNSGLIELAMDCLTDHTHGRCPQIPLHTMSILGAALLYFLDEMDLVPDFLPQLGDLDDAAVFQVAWDMAHPGVQRYCDATGRKLSR